ncbi:MAG TPA: hypothetical protein PKW95_09885 [bacterium]|nr:hypothetical protein [bacterium]
MKRNMLLALCLGILCLLLSVACAKKQTIVPPAAVTLEIRWAKTEPTPGFTPMTAEGPKKATFYLAPTPLLTGADIASAEVVESYFGPGVSFTLNQEGEATMRAFTREHIREHLAIIIDGRLVTAPVIQSEIGNRGLIDGGFALEEAQRIADGLNAGR